MCLATNLQTLVQVVAVGVVGTQLIQQFILPSGWSLISTLETWEGKLGCQHDPVWSKGHPPQAQRARWRGLQDQTQLLCVPQLYLERKYNNTRFCTFVSLSKSCLNELIYGTDRHLVKNSFPKKLKSIYSQKIT